MEETIILTFIGKDGVEYTLDYSNNYSVVANIALPVMNSLASLLEDAICI